MGRLIEYINYRHHLDTKRGVRKILKKPTETWKGSTDKADQSTSKVQQISTEVC